MTRWGTEPAEAGVWAVTLDHSVTSAIANASSAVTTWIVRFFGLGS
jgi:hypothetical protein